MNPSAEFERLVEEFLAAARAGTPADVEEYAARHPEAAELIRRALELGRQAATLGAAADLMEDAFNRVPGLRDRYVSKVRLWRNGVVQ